MVPVVGGSLNGTEHEAIGIALQRPIVDDEYLAEYNAWLKEYGVDYVIWQNLGGHGRFAYPPPSVPCELYKYELVDGERVRAVFAEVQR